MRVHGDPRAMMASIRREVAAVDPAVPLAEDYPLLDRVTFEFRPLRVATMTLVAFGARGVVRQSLPLAAIGVCLGIAVAALGARQIAPLPYGVPQYDLAAFLGAPLALLAVALAASYLPARRATRVEPSEALRATTEDYPSSS